MSVSDGTCGAARLAYTGVGDGPVRVAEAEDAVVGEPAAEATYAAAGETVRDHVDPPSDVHGSSGYRAHLVEALTGRALAAAAERSGGD